jgi:hypothetical protein
MRANPYSLELNYKFQDRRGLIKNDISKIEKPPQWEAENLAEKICKLIGKLQRSLLRLLRKWRR